MKKLLLLIALVLSSATFVGCGSEDAKKDKDGDKKEASKKESKDGKEGKSEAKDIVETAVAAGSFETLVAAVKAADLVETLKGAGPFTVFAPTDEAFEKLPEGTLEDLLKEENKPKLVKILTYHVVSGKVMAADVVEQDSVKMLQGEEATIAVDGDKVTIDGATVTSTDIECANGVIHIIDTVIMPKG